MEAFISRSESRVSNLSDSLLSEVSMELSQLVEHALATKDMIHTPKRAGTLPELPVNNKTPTFPQEISRPYSLRHSAAYAVSDGKDLDLEALRIKMDGLLKKMPNRETTSHNPSSPSANYLSRNANALARKMEEINTELEDIKSQLNHAYQSVQEPSLFIKPTEIESSERLFGSPSRKQRPESVAHPQLNNPDTSRFDAVPTCIRSYIREELAMMEDRVVTLVNEKIETMEMKLLKEINKTRRPGAGLENRIPWQVEVPASKTQAAKDNEPDDDKKTDFLLRELKDTFRRKGGSLNKKGPVDSTVHTRHTVASRMRCKK